MAEAAAITSARAHTINAKRYTPDNSRPNDTAAEEHRLAALDFARASRSTGDNEALRVLKLLETEHQRLADYLASRPSDTASDHGSEGTPVPVAEPKSSGAVPISPEATPTKTPSTTSAIAAARLNARTRDASPSLARDMASRRGIPQAGRNPPSPAAQARARQLSPESQRRAKPVVAPKIPPNIMDSRGSLPAKTTQRPAEDDGFTSFYNNITSGTMSKLSSVLAYAGLPLAPEESPKPEQQSAKPGLKGTVRASNEPDVKKYFSSAALKAIEDQHRQRGNQGHAFGPAESFYVVQKGGGTYSYADIARNQQASGGERLGEDDEDSFVDAKEAQAPDSPRHSSRPVFGKGRTAEELELENSTLKNTLEQLAVRLANFEAHAQDASMAALTQSMVSIHHGPPPASQTQTGGTNDEAAERVRALEAQIAAQAEQREKLERLAEKQEKKIRLYHSKWEEVKKSAKEKERVKREKAATSASEKPEESETKAG